MTLLTYAKSWYKKIMTTQVENPHAVFHFNTKRLLLWTTPKTLEPQWGNRLKELRIQSGLHSRKVELSRVKYFYAFVITLNCLFHRCKHEVVMRDWIENFPPFWQRTIRSESSQDKAGSLPPASWDYVMLFAIFSKGWNDFSLHQLNSKNDGPVLLFLKCGLQR